MQEYSKVHADFVKINENNLIEIENILCTMLEYLLLKFSNSVLSVCCYVVMFCYVHGKSRVTMATFTPFKFKLP